MNEELRQKYRADAGTPDHRGHVAWRGARARHDRPVILFDHKRVPAAAVAFWIRTGREPSGMARAECGFKHCVAPTHVVDDIERRDIRVAERMLAGMGSPWTTCPAGHGWDVNGRVAPDGDLYCRACKKLRQRGYGPATRTSRHTPEDSARFAEARADRIDGWYEKVRYFDTFTNARADLDTLFRRGDVVPDIEGIRARFRRVDPVLEAGYIEAMAALRAEGVEL